MQFSAPQKRILQDVREMFDNFRKGIFQYFPLLSKNYIKIISIIISIKLCELSNTRKTIYFGAVKNMTTSNGNKCSNESSSLCDHISR